MKFGKYLLIGILSSGCGAPGIETETVADDNQSQVDSTTRADTPEITGPVAYKTLTQELHANQRFRNVTVQALGSDSFLITGQGQIFEASFGWVIQDGHEELQSSFVTTDAGAPEWGNFSLKIHAPKKRPTSTLHLILFETSAMDGSRQHELSLLLH